MIIVKNDTYKLKYTDLETVQTKEISFSNFPSQLYTADIETMPHDQMSLEYSITYYKRKMLINFGMHVNSSTCLKQHLIKSSKLALADLIFYGILNKQNDDDDDEDGYIF